MKELQEIKSLCKALKGKERELRKAFGEFLEKWKEATDDVIADGALERVKLLEVDYRVYYLKLGDDSLYFVSEEAWIEGDFYHAETASVEYIDVEVILNIIDGLPGVLQKYVEKLKKRGCLYEMAVTFLKYGEVKDDKN